MSHRPRFLIVGSATAATESGCALPSAEDVCVDSWSEALGALRCGRFDALLADLRSPPLLDALSALHQAQRILAAVPDGVAVVDFDLRIRWSNPAFRAWCAGPVVGQGFYDALGSPEVLGPDYCPFHAILAAPSPEPPPTVTRLHCKGERYLDLHVRPLVGALRDPPPPTTDAPLFIALAHDVTELLRQEHKLDALHKAGRELMALAPEHVADMSVAERIELLKHNIRRLTRDLLRYQVIEVRLLDTQTGRLEPLLEDGMRPEAAQRVLLASPEGNGVTGYVAATGKSHLCPDTQADPLYLPGAPQAHSSLTVPLRFQDRVIGTLNVESPRPNADGENDLRLAEIFSHAVAAAITTLELLNAEKSSTVAQAIEAVNREVALPVDDILADVTSLIERYIGHDPDMADKLRKVAANARLIKQSIRKVGEDIAPERGQPGACRSAPAVSESGPAVPSLKGVRVLVADNDDRVRRSAHGLLGRWGCVVETARDGHEAVTMARLSTYDAILADIRLPDLSGYEAYRQLRAAQPHARVILMTGYGYDPGHSLVKARQDGLRHVLFKPFRVDQLRDALTNLSSDDKATG